MLSTSSKAGTSTKDLMVRMGQDDERAALHYQYASTEADQAIADRLSGLVDKHRREEGNDGVDGVLVPAG